MVFLCLNHNYFSVSEWDFFLFTCRQKKKHSWIKKKIKRELSPFMCHEELSWFKAQDEVHCQVCTYKQSRCLMLCDRSRILRVQLQQLSGWIFSSVTFDSSPPNCPSSSSEGERKETASAPTWLEWIGSAKRIYCERPPRRRGSAVLYWHYYDIYHHTIVIEVKLLYKFCWRARRGGHRPFRITWF